MSKFDHWMRFNIGDYLGDTMDLSTYQHGIYILLIMHYFRRGGLPPVADRSALARIAKVPAKQWTTLSPQVLQLFQVVEGQIRHKRIDAERARSQEVSDAKRIGATALHRKRREGPPDLFSGAAYAGGNGAYADANAGLARGGARPEQTPEPEPYPYPSTEDPPHPPRKRGGGAGDDLKNGGRGRREPRNGFVAEAVEIIEGRPPDNLVIPIRRVL